jgi:hypothetical protein
LHRCAPPRHPYSRSRCSRRWPYLRLLSIPSTSGHKPTRRCHWRAKERRPTFAMVSTAQRMRPPSLPVAYVWHAEHTRPQFTTSATRVGPSRVETEGNPKLTLPSPPSSYEVTGQGKGYEIRKYPATKWATTAVTDVSLQQATGTGFRVSAMWTSNDSSPIYPIQYVSCSRIDLTPLDPPSLIPTPLWATSTLAHSPPRWGGSVCSRTSPAPTRKERPYP